MNILFLTLVNMNSLDEKGLYTDLLREFRKNGHHIFAVNPTERRNNKSTYLVSEKGADILHVKTFNIQKTNIIEKGIATLAIEFQYLKAIKKYFPGHKFDLILYSTPPITFSKVIKYIKNRDGAFSYLLLKDIFPQNAVDMKMIKEKGVLHRMFLKKEKKLYNLSDKIGCMSDANLNFVLKHNSYINREKIEVNPNSIDPEFKNHSIEDLTSIRIKFELPLDKMVFVYGGNLGKPQGIDFLIETIEKLENPNAYFLIVGSGTEYKKIKKWFEQHNPKNAKLINFLPKIEYDNLLKACDVGLLFLHKDFTIPNFPSRLLSYLEYGLPVIAATDNNTDVGAVIENAGCGFWSQAGDIENMKLLIDRFTSNGLDLVEMKHNSRNLLETKFHVKKSYDLIIDSLTKFNTSKTI
jgi:glycosyltransferase involved in cell wall biosynthesis